MSSAEVEFAVDTAKRAGAVLMKYFGGPLQHHIKSNKDDFYTEADLAAEKVLIGAIKKEFPSDAILSEEAGYLGNPDAEYTWILDPLDGTYNFAHGVTEFGPMMARAHGKELTLAVLFNPAKNELAAASPEIGTLLNGEPVELTPASSLKEASLLSSCISDLPGAAVVKAITALVQGQHIPIHSIHSAIGNTFSILHGLSDAWIINYIHAWDIAPTVFVLEQAGLITKTARNTEASWQANNEAVIHAPAQLMDELLRIAEEVRST